MSLQWMKKKMKGFEAKKENSKVNERLHKLISDIKSKRDTLASVQTGFPSSVASFVTNTWMPSHEGDDLPVKKKKKRWPCTKKGESCKESDLNKAKSLPLNEVCDPSLRSESVGRLEATPQLGKEISEQISNDPQIVGLFQIYPEVVGHVGNNPHVLGHFGNDPENLGHFDNNLSSGGQFSNDPQPAGQISTELQSVGPLGRELKPKSEFGYEAQGLGQVDNHAEIVGHLLKQNPQDQILKDANSLGQLETGDPFPPGHTTLCPMCSELLAIVVLLAVFISVVLDAKMAAVGVTVIVYFALRVLFGKQESLSRSSILSILSCVWKAPRSLCRATIGKISFLKCKKGLRSGSLPSEEASSCCLLPSFFERIRSVLLNTDSNNQPKRSKVLVQNAGINMSVAKERKLSSALAACLWIVVLVGLIKGRFNALILALAWCLLVKLAQIAEQRQIINP